ncbi:Low-density lipoprotein receptor-related protein [Thelohanellus kitauei]|uniref:Low-density lipoprotein receptor-related protein n=1 Tax=Thelohanellus kitauei TaxID=669202 RepID=A0A0C2MVS9_THEKT|nr:Low-density lipoprotein receptor-related protein [Thelohanellus kitauei]
MRNHRWILISGNVIEAHWHNDILYYLHASLSVTGGRQIHSALNSYKVETMKKSIVAQNVKNFGISNQAVWWVAIIKDQLSLIFYIDSIHHSAIFGDANIVYIIAVSIQNQIVLVTAMGEYNGFESLWLAEVPDFVFSKISSHIMGFDQDNDIPWLLYGRIQFFATFIEKFTGIIFVSYTIQSDGQGIHKHTVISYNNGNSFLPLKYKTKDGLCEMHECQIFIPPTNDQLSDSIKIAQNNPMLMIAQCILIRNGKVNLPTFMISTDGGYSWRQIIPEFKEITILSEGEVIIGVNSRLHPLEYNYYQGKCFTHSKNYVHKRLRVCDDPSEYVESKIKPKKFIGNICVKDSMKEEMEICRFHQNRPTITLLIKSKLTFVDIDLINKGPTIFSSDLQLDERILDFKFDKFRKCIYYHVKNGIIRKCYGNKREIAKPHIFIIRDITIMGIDLDYMNHYLFYFTKHEIMAVNLKTFVKTIIHKTQNFIRYLKLDVSRQKMIISYFEKQTRRSKISVLSFSAAVEALLDFEKEIHEIIYYLEALYIYTDEGIYEYQIWREQLKIANYSIPNVKYLQAYHMKEYITNYGYADRSYFVLMKNIQQANMELKVDPYKQQPCRFSHCEYFCLSTLKDSFICGCPDGMILNKLTQKCVCPAPHQNCSICRPNEYYCENRQCIPQKCLCNGIDDCGDGSDEARCPSTCERNEIFCFADRKCLNENLICNRVNDCSDGMDEFECEKIIPRCNEYSYECYDERCIPKSKVCDGKNDCGDFSDEKDCLEKQCEDFGSFCDDGTCLYHDKLCDETYDCIDFSDERACNTRVFFHQNISCLISCDKRCLPINKICDHLTDCQDGSDEKKCGFRTRCPIIKPINCDDGEGCYEESEKCDGFKDCSDGSDEKKCRGIIPCAGDEMFTCGSNAIICMSKVCDGFTHCEDQSDEKRHCGNNNSIQDVNYYAKDGGVVSFSWTQSISSLPFEILIHSMNKNIDVIRKQTHKSIIDVKGHVECERYVLIVKNQEFVIRYLQYKYIKPSNSFTPRKLKYERKSHILSWQVTIPMCISPVFYIECLRGIKLVYRNFSVVNMVKLNLDYPFICSVSTCPKSIFNMSCSQFSEIVIDEIWILKYKYTIIWTSISFSLVVILLLVCLFVRTKRFDKLTIKHLKFQPLVENCNDFQTTES